MKKNKLTTKQKKASIKRSDKKNARKKRTKAENNLHKVELIKKKNRLQEKQDEEIMKILQSRQS